MATEVASAYVTLLPSAKGFGAGIERELGGDLDRAGRDGGKRMGGGLKSGLLSGVGKLGGPLAAAFAAVGIGKIVSDSIGAEADFSKTIRQIGVAADASAPQVDQLRKLAIKLGADTSFSAGEAADAMLELAKGGLTPAVIQGGALKSVMALAAAGELGLAEAAGLTSAAMHTFNISAKDSASIADALAGGANASSADVTTLGQALTQAGTGASSAGLSLNETVGALAALADKGIQGSDAGTSLKTMLSRLVPATDDARSTMKKLGLDFTDARGNFVSITDVAEQLQLSLGDMSESQRTAALQTLFGSDAIRSATALYELGGKGLNKYIGATEKTGSAQKLADASMQGTSGALERLSGAYDTAKLAVGTFLAPATVAVANALSGVLGGLATKLTGLKLPDLSKLFGGGGAGGILRTLQPLIAGVQSYVGSLIGSFNALKGPVLGFISALVPPIREFVTALIATLGPGLASIGETIRGTFVPAVAAILPVLAPVAAFLLRVLGSAVIGALKGVINVIRGVLTAISGIFNVFAGIFTGDWSRVWLGVKQIFSGVFRALLGLVQVIWNVGIIRLFRVGFAAIGGIFRGGAALIRGLWSGGLRAVEALPRVIWASIRGIFRNGISGTGAIIRNGVQTYIGIWRAGLGVIVSAIRAGIGKAVGVLRGLPGRIKGAVGDLAGLLRNAGARLIQGLIDGIKSRIAGIGAVMSSVAGKIKGFFPGSPIKTGPLKNWNNGGAGKRLMDLLHDGIKKNRKKVIAAAESVAKGIADKLQKAETKLKDLQQVSKSYASGISDSVRLADLRGDGETAPTAGGIIGTLQKQLDAAKKFKSEIKKLTKAGLNKTTLQQILDLGPEEGGAIADALLKGGKKSIKQVNSLQGQLNSTGKSLGDSAAKTMYGAGIKAAQGLVDGLKSQAKALQKFANSLGKEIAKGVRKALDIHSPSRLMHYIGKVQTAGALASGLEAGRPDVAAAAARLGASVARTAIRPMRAPGFALDGQTGAGRGDTITFGDVYAFTPESLRKELDERQQRRDALQPAW